MDFEEFEAMLNSDFEKKSSEEQKRLQNDLVRMTEFQQHLASPLMVKMVNSAAQLINEHNLYDQVQQLNADLHEIFKTKRYATCVTFMILYSSIVQLVSEVTTMLPKDEKGSMSINENGTLSEGEPPNENK